MVISMFVANANRGNSSFGGCGRRSVPGYKNKMLLPAVLTQETAKTFAALCDCCAIVVRLLCVENDSIGSLWRRSTNNNKRIFTKCNRRQEKLSSLHFYFIEFDFIFFTNSLS